MRSTDLSIPELGTRQAHRELAALRRSGQLASAPSKNRDRVVRTHEWRFIELPPAASI